LGAICGAGNAFPSGTPKFITQEIMDAIDEIPYRYGSTNTYGGLRMMRTEFFSVANGDREDVPDVKDTGSYISRI
jgi:secreted protein with Ig-like and vWFA domain